MTFREALNKFNQYVTEFNGGRTPDHLHCVYDNGGINNIKTWIKDNEGGEGRVENIRTSDNINLSRTEVIAPPTYMTSSENVHVSQVHSVPSISAIPPRQLERVSAPIVEERVIIERQNERPMVKVNSNPRVVASPPSVVR